MIYFAFFLLGAATGIAVSALIRAIPNLFNFEATAYDAPIFPAIDEKPRLVSVKGRMRVDPE